MPDHVYHLARFQSGFERSVSETLLFTEGLLRLFSGSRAEQLAMDSGSGFREPDLDLMLLMKHIKVSRILCQHRMLIIRHETDGAFCLVKVDREELNPAIHPFLLRWKDGDFLNAEYFRQKAMEIVEQNRHKHNKWSTIETHGPACKATLTPYGDLDIVMSISCTLPFCDMIDFRSRVMSKNKTYWRDVVPYKRLCELDGVLVPICPRESDGITRQLTFRKSFSAQEFILISSLPHWCRQAAVVFKHTVLQKLKTVANCPEDAPTICSYHLKTIFLWTVESMDPKMWNKASPAQLLGELLHMLICALGKREIENYWIPRSNLLKYHSTEYLSDCCLTLKCVKSNIITCVLGAPENPHVLFGAKASDNVKDIFFKANHDACSVEDFGQLIRDITHTSTCRRIMKLLLESSGSPQYLQQVGDMVYGLQCLLWRIYGEDDGQNHGFVMASYIVESLFRQSDNYDGG